MATINTLNKGLEQLQTDVAEQNKLYVSSKIALYKALVDTYLWWREASQKKDYLEKLFTAESIKFKKKLNRPNFNPVIRLVFQMQQHLQNVQISNWGSALNAIDDEYLRNGDIYRHRNASSELVSWIDDNGGLSGICGRKKEDIDEYGYDYKDAGVKKTSKRKNTENKQKQQLEVLQLKKLATAAVNKPQKIDIGKVGTGEDDFIVILAKATGRGNQLQVIGTTAQQAIVDNAVMQIGEIDYSSISNNLRMLCDAISINTIPKALQGYGARKNFYKTTKLEVERRGKKEKLRERARLVLQRNGTILVSKSSCEASLTTYYTPNKKIRITEDLWLRGNDSNWLETELINESEIALYKAKPNNGLDKQRNKKLQAVKQIELYSALTKHKRNLYFYDFSRVDDDTMSQPQIIGGDIQYDWEINGNPAYFKRLYEQHFDGWQHRVKHRVHTPNNKAIAFRVGKNGITCEKKWDKAEGSFTQYGTRYLTAFSNDANADGKGKIIFAPTDIIGVLEMIYTHKIAGSVQMCGNDDLMFIKFQNDIAEIQVYIPASTITGKRSTTYFTKFVPND